MLKIKKLQTTPFHPESNGGLERGHRILKYLRHYIDEDQSNTSTGYTPFELVQGFKSSMPSALQENPSVQYTYDDFLLN
jgi:hypothetical protein